MNTHKPCEFIGFGDIHGPKPYEFIRFGDIHGPKPYKSIGFGDIDVTGPVTMTDSEVTPARVLEEGPRVDPGSALEGLDARLDQKACSNPI